jgi:hypothetical protein
MFPAENPQIRFAKSLGFYEDAEWTLNRASIGVRTIRVLYFISALSPFES